MELLQTRFDKVYEALAKKSLLQFPTIVAASKNQELKKMLAWETYARGKNIRVVFGESYIQELQNKKLSGEFDAGTLFHFIGRLQSNKASLAVQFSDVIESVHSKKIIDEVAKAAVKLNKVQDIFLQINISQDENKAGFLEEELGSIVPYALGLESIRMIGLMTITEYYDNHEEVRGDFIKMRLCRDRYLPGAAISMGMSSDFLIALEEGATHVRIGSALFGERN